MKDLKRNKNIGRFNKMDSKKNVILLTVDCLRADHLSCMNYPKNITPELDNISKDGMLFTNVISNAPHTYFSVPSFFTSTVPPVSKKSTYTLMRHLKNNGYATASFNPNPILISNAATGGWDVRKDFDTYEVFLNEKKLSKIKLQILRIVLMSNFRNFFKENGIIHNVAFKIFDKLIKRVPSIFCYSEDIKVPRAPVLNKEAINWIKNQKNNYFVWIHYMDVHDPYVPVHYENRRYMLYLVTKYRDFPNKLSKEEIQELIKLYDLEIEYTDRAIGEFIKELKKQDLLKDTIILISADHGDAFNEHGTLGHGTKLPPKLYHENIHVPFIIYGLEKGKKIGNQFDLLGLSPTICDILNIESPPSFFGKSFFKSLNQPIISRCELSIAFLKDGYKLIIYNDETLENELYNLKTDPLEKQNIYEKNPKISKSMESDMISLLNSYKKKRKLLEIPKTD